MLYRGICLLFFSKTDHTKEKMDEEMVHVVGIQFEINLFNRKKVMKNIILFKIWGANNLKKLDAFQCFVLLSENLPGFSRTFRRWSNPLRWFRRSWGRRRTGRPVAGRQPWQEFRAGSNTWKNKRPIVGHSLGYPTRWGWGRLAKLSRLLNNFRMTLSPVTKLDATTFSQSYI